MVFRGLAHGKWVLEACHTVNGFWDVVPKEIVSRGLSQREWFLGAGNCLERLSRRKIVVRRLLHGKYS